MSEELHAANQVDDAEDDDEDEDDEGDDYDDVVVAADPSVIHVALYDFKPGGENQGGHSIYFLPRKE